MGLNGLFRGTFCLYLPLCIPTYIHVYTLYVYGIGIRIIESKRNPPEVLTVIGFRSFCTPYIFVPLCAYS